MTGNRIVFILSARRSGSTWVGYVLGNSAESAFLGEYYRGWNPELRQPCAWCAANSVPACPVLSGYEGVSFEQAFAFAFERTGRAILIDSSKTVGWARLFIESRPRYDIHLIHLIRDPRGWYASEKRRDARPLTQLLRSWIEANLGIQDFVRSYDLPCTTVFYDELACDPEAGFQRLYRQLGLAFEPQCLRYWERSHHAFAANGASSLLLFEAPNNHELPYFITGDDSFYRSQHQKFFFDRRWQETLSFSDSRMIEENSDVMAFFSLYGRVLSGCGVALRHKAGSHSFQARPREGMI